MHTEHEVNEMIRLLEECYPEPRCTLNYEKDYELLFSARLAAQCTDERVNMITPELFGKHQTLEQLANADLHDIEKIIRSCGFYRIKARDILASANMLLSEFGGRVPSTMDDLLRLPGVGRKTANLILGDVHKLPAVVVDTHCIRLSNRIGLVNTKDPKKIEILLKDILPEDKSSDFCHRLVLHGREVCKARTPICGKCCIMHYCKFEKR